MEKVNCTYIIECADGTLYTGWTNDIIERLHKHNSGKGAKYTRSRTPVALRYIEVAESKSAAMKREAAIKKLSREEKLELIKKGNSKTFDNYNEARKDKFWKKDSTIKETVV